MAKRRNFSAAFKAKVVTEALRGDQTLAEMGLRAIYQAPRTSELCGNLGDGCVRKAAYRGGC